MNEIKMRSKFNQVSFPKFHFEDIRKSKTMSYQKGLRMLRELDPMECCSSVSTLFHRMNSILHWRGYFVAIPSHRLTIFYPYRRLHLHGIGVASQPSFSLWSILLHQENSKHLAVLWGEPNLSNLHP